MQRIINKSLRRFNAFEVRNIMSVTIDDMLQMIFSARCNIYISRLCYDVSVRLSVRLSVTEVHLRIIANLGFKFRYPNLPRIVVAGRGNLSNISRYASHC